MEPYWVLHISTHSEFMDFLKVRESMFAHSFLDVKENASLDSDDYSKRSDGGHFDALGSIITRELRNSPKRLNNIVEELEYLGERLTLPIIKVFNQFGEIFVNERFGFCIPQGMHYEVLETRQSEILPVTDPSTYNHPTMTFPHKRSNQDIVEVRYIQWVGGGSHWYVKIGNEDVVWEGEQKWDTREEAERVANLYIQKHQLKISP